MPFCTFLRGKWHAAAWMWPGTCKCVYVCMSKWAVSATWAFACDAGHLPNGLILQSRRVGPPDYGACRIGDGLAVAKSCTKSLPQRCKLNRCVCVLVCVCVSACVCVCECAQRVSCARSHEMWPQLRFVSCMQRLPQWTAARWMTVAEKLGLSGE